MAKRTRRKAGKRPAQPLPGWIYLVFGLGVGMAVAYIYYEGFEMPQPRPAKIQPAPPGKPAPPPVVTEEPAEAGITFDFYEMLPELDVEVFSDEAVPARKPVLPARVKTPGIYILQAGSFSTLNDAKKREGEIALLGVSADIKKGDANGRTVYRVYTRPLETTDDVNRLSVLLNENGIETLPKRVK
jgi:cell division protein FtsN